MSVLSVTVIILGCIAVGEILSALSKARIPSILVAMLLAFVLANLGFLPYEMAMASALVAFGSWAQSAVMIHMGSLIPIGKLLVQWRPVAIAVSGIVMAAVFVLGIGTWLYGFDIAAASVGPMTGGLVATTLMNEGLQGIPDLDPLALMIPSMLLMVQCLPGMPVASTLLRRYALAHRETLTPEPGPEVGDVEDHIDEDGDLNDGHRTLIQLPDAIAENSYFALFMAVALGWVARVLEDATGVSYSLWGLAIGFIGAYIGLVPRRPLEKSGSFGIIMASLVFLVIVPLTGFTFADLASIAGILIVMMIAGFGGVFLGGAIMTKLVGWDLRLGIPVALTSTFGFPADYMISQEVVKATGRTKKEQAALREQILLPMLIGGFSTVSAGAIVIVSIILSVL